MVDTKKVQEKSSEALYAALGAGDAAAEWLRDYTKPEGFKSFWTGRRQRLVKEYRTMARRGHKVAERMRHHELVTKTEEQTKVARERIGSAVGTVRKTVRPSASKVEKAPAKPEVKKAG